MANVKNQDILEELQIDIVNSLYFYDKEEWELFYETFRKLELNDKQLKFNPFFIDALEMAEEYYKLTEEERRGFSFREFVEKNIRFKYEGTKLDKAELWLDKVKRVPSTKFELHEELIYKFVWECMKQTNENISNMKMPYKDKVLANNKVSFGDIVDPDYKMFTDLTDEEAGIEIPTGIQELDDIIHLQKGFFVTVGARSGSGKTVFAINHYVNACKLGYNVLVVPLEMTGAQMKKRTIARVIGKPVTEPISYYNDDPRLEPVNEHLSFLFNLNGRELFETLKQIIKEKKIDMVVIDHLQLVRVAGMSEFESFREATFVLNNIAKQLNVCMVICCQLKRESEQFGVSLSSFFGSSTIEHESDVAIALETEKHQGSESGKATTNISILKNRHGASGDIIKTIVTFPTCSYETV